MAESADSAANETVVNHCARADARTQELLRQLDHGHAALPPGSEVVLANGFAAAETLGHALAHVPLENIKVPPPGLPGVMQSAVDGG